MRATSYDALALSPLLIHDYRLIKETQSFQFLAPVLVTGSPEHRSLAQEALENEAFDLIVTPIVPDDAVQTVRLALWQNRLLRLLVSKERMLERFREHMEAFPHARHAEANFIDKLAAFDRTIHAVRKSVRLLLNSDDERSLFDMAASVEQFTKQRALDRLLNLCKEGPAQ